MFPPILPWMVLTFEPQCRTPVVPLKHVTTDFWWSEPPLRTNQQGTNADIVWSEETIDTAGEFYTVKIAGGGRFLIGLGREEDGDRDRTAQPLGQQRRL